MNLQVQSIQKTQSGALDISFPTAYSVPPVVLLTPYWKGSSAGVGNVSTITQVTTGGCTVVSNNYADSNYFLNVMSIDASDPGSIGNLGVISGSAAKTSSMLTVNFTGRLSSPDPSVLLTAFWQGSTGQVGNVETLDISAASEIKIVSGNHAANDYFVNYMVLDLGVTSQNGKKVASGIANKTGPGLLRVYFSTPMVNPVVFLSPWWNEQNQGVGYMETLVTVTPDYFECASGNGGSNYFVNWIAVEG